jgi:hypothetical protein
VYAFPAELDAWLYGRTIAPPTAQDDAAIAAADPEISSARTELLTTSASPAPIGAPQISFTNRLLRM